MIIPVLGYSGKQPSPLMDRVSVAGWLPLGVQTVLEARDRAAARLVESLPVVHEVHEESRQNRTDGPTFFSCHAAHFAEQIGVESIPNVTFVFMPALRI